jgi:hypothetical protein
MKHERMGVSMVHSCAVSRVWVMRGHCCALAAGTGKYGRLSRASRRVLLMLEHKQRFYFLFAVEVMASSSATDSSAPALLRDAPSCYTFDPLRIPPRPTLASASYPHHTT